MSNPTKSIVTAGLPSYMKLPGFTLPLNHTTPTVEYTDLERQPNDGPALFPTALDGGKLEQGICALPMLTLREYSMLHIMSALTDKPGWEEKVFDDEIALAWKQEAIATEGADVSERMMDYVIAELRHKANKFKESGTIIVYNGDVVKSDTVIPADLKAALQAAVKPLEDIPPHKKDFHPGSNNQVVDLVHPSLWPLVYGRSRVLEDSLLGLEDCIERIGEGKTIPIRDDSEAWPETPGRYLRSPLSKNFQWLPCDVEIRDGQAKIVSYINNLHPKNNETLYTIIAEIITKTIPLWNTTLSGCRKDYQHPKRINAEVKFDPDPDQIPEAEKPQRLDGEDGNTHWHRVLEWEDNVRTVVFPEPDEFQPHYEDTSTLINLFEHHAKEGLQVIVKLANIELSPENPDYPGGSWHVEGQLNERICATALFYYDNDNISDTYLAFRQQVDQDDVYWLDYPQNVHGWLTDLFGCEQDGPTVQDVGTVLCKEGRLLTFPNILQHQVQPFKLEDPTKPGHRKILALFLVDPRIKVISTANVPPQQRDWWSDKLRETFAGTSVALGGLSNELKDKVFEAVDDFPIGLEEAKEIRLRLMEERKHYVLEHAHNFEANKFSLCEH